MYHSQSIKHKVVQLILRCQKLEYKIKKSTLKQNNCVKFKCPHHLDITY